MTTAWMNSCHDSELGGLIHREKGRLNFNFSWHVRQDGVQKTTTALSWSIQLVLGRTSCSGAFKATIFISHPPWAVLIYDEGLVVWRENGRTKTAFTCTAYSQFHTSSIFWLRHRSQQDVYMQRSSRENIAADIFWISQRRTLLVVEASWHLT